MTTQESLKHVCKPGYWLINVAEIGDAPDWQEVIQPPPESNLLFGYEVKEFMAKQYK